MSDKKSSTRNALAITPVDSVIHDADEGAVLTSMSFDDSHGVDTNLYNFERLSCTCSNFLICHILHLV